MNPHERPDAKPGWSRQLLPDELSSRRMHRTIMARAEPLLRARRRSWLDVAERWSGALMPSAAVLALAAGFIGYQATGLSEDPAELDSAPVITLDQLVGPESDATAFLLTSSAEPSPDAVLTAAISRD